ncbi:MAG: hypothetical protein ACO1NZ_14890 [Adhaeribacter sp.]
MYFKVAFDDDSTPYGHDYIISGHRVTGGHKSAPHIAFKKRQAVQPAVFIFPRMQLNHRSAGLLF